MFLRLFYRKIIKINFLILYENRWRHFRKNPFSKLVLTVLGIKFGLLATHSTLLNRIKSEEYKCPTSKSLQNRIVLTKFLKRKW